MTNETRYVDDRFLASAWLDALRTEGQDLAQAEDWAGLHARQQEFRRDTEWWPDVWGPLCAVAARRVGDPGARSLLDEVVANGYGQPEILDGELEAAFGDEADWPEILGRIAGNVDSPPIELTGWPCVTPTAPLRLFRLPADREELLRQRIPQPAGTAWETALRLLGWVTSRWRHANAHMDVDDAVTCLDRVEAGERFACVEYTLVLCQALNASGIPSRSLKLRQDNYHVGLGRGHLVSEAWIDELSRWVVLDGQNGLYWADAAGEALGAVQLRDWLRRAEPRPRAVTVAEASEMSDRDADQWFTYFAHSSSTGATWAGGAFVPVFQRDHVTTVERLERAPGPVYPDLGEVGIGVGLADGRIAVRMFTGHPFASGFRVRVDGTCHDLSLEEPQWTLDVSPGEHTVELAARTRYGVLTAHPLSYRAR